MSELQITVTDGLVCPNCGAPEVVDDTLPVADWRFYIRAFRVDDWSECLRCKCWFNRAGDIQEDEA